MNMRMLMFVVDRCSRPMLHMLDEMLSAPNGQLVIKRPCDEATMNALCDRGLVQIELISAGVYTIRLRDEVGMGVEALRSLAHERKLAVIAKECGVAI